MAGSYDFEEQERIAELKAWWEDNRFFVMGAVAAAIIGYASFQGWQHWQVRQAEDAAAMYKPVTEAQATGDASKVGAAAERLMKEHPGSYYASDAALVAAKAAFEAGKLEDARRQLEWTMSHGVEAHRGIARVRLASVLLEEKKYEDALKVLEGNQDPAFAALAADQRGDVMLAQGRLDEARAAYKAAIEKSDARNPVRGMAENKLAALGGAQ